MNFHKSSLIGVYLSEDFMERGSSFLSCRTSLIPFKFLGLPVGANPRRRTTWKPVLDLVRGKLFS